jgi:hypothetical protein
MMIHEISCFNEFSPFPAYSEREAWVSLPEKVKDRYCSEAKKLLNCEWPTLTASLYLEFSRSGNRSEFEGRYFGRRYKLLTLLLAECISGSGEYLDKIIDGVWLIAEESTWVPPAHLDKSKVMPSSLANELPYPGEEPYVDLFAAETAALFSWVYYFLGEALAARAPLLVKRMEWEVERRIFLPFLNHNNFSWMGLADDKPVNNWNPWINSNLLSAFLIFAKSFPRFQEGINKTIASINRFIDGYAEDGGCDEGSGYFSKAAASLFDFIEELNQITDASYLYRSSKLRNMAAYIHKVYIAGNYFVNFADAAPEAHIPIALMQRTGEKIGDADLCNFAAWLQKSNSDKGEFLAERGFSIYRLLADIFTPPPSADKEAAPVLPEVSWFPGIQVVCARDNSGGATDSGLFFAAKGGHNNESHNHNDIGNFILYCDGAPVVIDAGVETYTKFTFNEKRYSLWTMQSCYHNTPAINGRDQLYGLEYRASDVIFSHDAGTVKLSMDIADAYPGDAGIQSYKREFIFRRNESLLVTDTYLLGECAAPPVLHLLCREKPRTAGTGLLLGGTVQLEFDAAALDSALDEIPLTDPKMAADWHKDKLYRLRLTVTSAAKSGEVKLRFFKK